MIMLLAEKVSKILKHFNFLIKSRNFCRCCETSWNGRCCEFPLEAEKPKPQKGFFNRLFSGHNTLNLILSLAKKANPTDHEEHHNAAKMKKEHRNRPRHRPYYKRKHTVPYYTVIYNGPVLT